MTEQEACKICKEKKDSRLVRHVTFDPETQTVLEFFIHLDCLPSLGQFNYHRKMQLIKKQRGIL